MNEFTRLSIAACTSLGFTTGIDDEDLTAEALEAIHEANAAARALVEEELARFEAAKGDPRKYEPRPGRTMRETLEENIMVMLDEGKQAAGDVAKNELNQSGSTNAAVNMAISGARGSMDNLNMMAGSIGQAKVRGKRLERGYNERVLLTSSEVVEERKTVDSSPVHSSVVLNQRSSLCSPFLVVSPLSILLFVRPSPDTCNADSSTQWMTSRSSTMTCSRTQHGKPNYPVLLWEDGIDPSRGVHGAAFNIDVIIDGALGTEGGTKVTREHRTRRA